MNVPAIVIGAVVLIAIAVAIIFVRRRRGRSAAMTRTGASPMNSAQRVDEVRQVLAQWQPKAESQPAVSPTPGLDDTAVDREASTAGDAGTAPSTAAPSVPVCAAPACAAEPIASAAEPHTADRLSAPIPSLVTTDPLRAVILDMLQGQGRISEDDWSRLDVFRLESVHAAALAFDLPPKLRTNESALNRLAQIQLYAASHGLRAKMAAESPRSMPGVAAGSLTARELKQKMAADIVALPPSDRADVIGALLVHVLRMNGDRGLKLGVIDTLEHLHSSALVDVLLVCLDDSDLLIRSYALEAADRLLSRD
jgi:hypothetical protein